MENKNTYLSEKEKAIHMFGWTSKRYKGISIAYIAMLFITFPLIEILALLQDRGETSYNYINEITYAAPSIAGSVFAFVTILFSTIFAVVVFSYMHNKRCMDLFGSFPISRRALFFTRYISVLAQILVPLIVVGLIGAILTLKMSTFVNVMQIIAYLSLGVIGNISFIALLSLCCGTVVDVLVSFLAVNGIYPVCIVICTVFPSAVLPGYSVNGNDINGALCTLLSPLIAPFAGIWSDCGSLYIGWWIVFSIVLILGCFVFSKKRKTETAQNSFVFVTVEQAIKVISGFVIGFGMGWLFVQFMSNDEVSYKEQYIWFFVGLCIGAFMTEIILHLIYHRGLTKIKMSIIVGAIDVVMVSAFVMIVVTGAFGYDERIPDVDNIQAVSVSMDSDESYIVNGVDVGTHYSTNKNAIEDAVQVHETIVEDKVKEKKTVYPFVRIDDYVTYDSEEKYYDTQIILTYKLKNGSTMKRTYDGYFDRKKIERLNKYSESDRDEKKLLEILPHKDLSDATIYNCKKGYTLQLLDSMYNMSEKDIMQLKNALIKDYSILDNQKRRKKDNLYEIRFAYNNSGGQYIEVPCVVTSEFKNTLEVLKSGRYKNMDFMFLQEDVYENSPGSFGWSEDNEKSVYFKVPDDWNKKAEIRAILYNSETEEWMCENLKSQATMCENVNGNVWKYSYSNLKSTDDEEKEYYNKIMFYQILEDTVNISGAIKLPQDTEGNCLVLTKKKDVIFVKYWRAMYQYTWEKLK